MSTKPFITLPSLKGIEFISPQDIIVVSSENKTILINMENSPPRKLSMTLTRAEIILSNPCFVRCHQRHIVNVFKIKEVIDQYTLIVLTNNQQIPISRAYRKIFKQDIEEFCEKLSG